MSDPSEAPKVPLVENEDDEEPVDETEIPSSPSEEEEVEVDEADAPDAPVVAEPEPEPTTAGELGFFDYVPIFSMLMIVGAFIGLVLFRGENISNKAQRAVNSPFVYGILVMLHGVYGSKGITEPPAALATLLARPGAKIFTLLLVSFAAVRDLEDAVFAAVLFLGLTQFMRSPTERRAKPHIL